MSYYPKKKYYKYWGVVLPLPLPPPLPQEKRNPIRGPPLRRSRSFINLNLIRTYYPTSIVFYLYYHFTICIHLLLIHVITSCHLVMSYRHVIQSLAYTHYIAILTNLIRIHLDNIYVTWERSDHIVTITHNVHSHYQ